MAFLVGTSQHSKRCPRRQICLSCEVRLDSSATQQHHPHRPIGLVHPACAAEVYFPSTAFPCAGIRLFVVACPRLKFVHGPGCLFEESPHTLPEFIVCEVLGIFLRCPPVAMAAVDGTYRSEFLVELKWVCMTASRLLAFCPLAGLSHGGVLLTLQGGIYRLHRVTLLDCARYAEPGFGTAQPRTRE